MKRRKWLVLGIASVLAFGVRGTYALYQSTVSVQNHIQTGDINIGIQEYEEKEGKEFLYTGSECRKVLPSQRISKIPRVTNYAEPCYLRVKISSHSEMPDCETQEIFGMSEEWIQAEGYYYWPEPLETGESVDIFQGVTP